MFSQVSVHGGWGWVHHVHHGIIDRVGYPPHLAYPPPPIGHGIWDTHPSPPPATDIWSLEDIPLLELTPSGSHRNMYGWQAPGKHPKGMPSCLVLCQNSQL